MISIYHNPRCSKSRETLAILEDEKVEHHVIKYLDGFLTEGELKNIIRLLKIKPLQLVRTNESFWKENFKDSKLTDEELVTIMVKNPKLIERPIVINGDKAVIGRPPIKVLDIL